MTADREAVIRKPTALKGSTVWLIERVEELEAELAAARERLAEYEEPGWITPIQKVQELKRELAAAREENQTLREALHRIEAGESVPGGAGVIRGDAAKIARAALTATGGQE